MRGRALALWCVVAAATVASPGVCFTVDCDRDYADCDTELSKLSSDNNDERAEESVVVTTSVPYMDDTTHVIETSTPFLPTIPTPKTNEDNFNITEQETIKPRARLLNINMDELNPLEHNETEYLPKNKKVPDLSDVTLDEDDDDDMKFMGKDDFKMKLKPSESDSEVSHDINENFFTHLKAPFHPSSVGEKASTELEMCKEKGMPYRIGDHIERGCEEICECTPSGSFECFPRCKHPYIRRGRTLNDPLCFESPVDECCSIMACATGNHGDLKPSKTNTGPSKVEQPDVCRFGNNTYKVGTKWDIGCEQVCTCENNAVVMCKPRCPVLPAASEKCINVQNPNDECCEIQVCDVSQDDHEESVENATINATTEKTKLTEKTSKNKTEFKTTLRPLVLAEPIGSVKVLHNNSVQINLIHMNTSNDPIHLLLSSDGGKTFSQVELKYNNLLLNLVGGKDYVIKTQETGTKFNFTITATDNGDNEVKVDDLKNVTSKIGCEHDGQFYEVGEEFHIGCSELCECTGPDTKECAALECPAHVGLELVFRGCVRWAPSPPPQPPNCCPRAARCLSDGTCQYNEYSILNWSEVPIEITGCEKRCFCENGELDCQEICAPLPELPPQNLRCPIGHRPAPVNITDEECCKEWGCISNAKYGYNPLSATESMLSSVALNFNYVTPVVSVAPTITSVLLTPPTTTDVNFDFQRYLTPIKTLTSPKIIKTIKNIQPYSSKDSNLNAFNYFNNNFQPYDNYYSNSEQNANIEETINHLENSKTYFKNISGNNNVNDLPMINKHIPTKNVINETYPQKYTLTNHNIYKVDSIFNDETKSNSQIVHNNPHLQLVKDGSKIIPENFSKQFNNNQTPQKYNLFKPTKNITTFNLPHSKPVITSNSPANKNNQEQHLRSSLLKHITILNAKDLVKTHDYKDVDTFSSDTQTTHVLTKGPKPYENMLLRSISTSNNNLNYDINKNKGNSYSALDLEHILSQIEIETELNRNFERSAQNARVKRPKAGLTPNKVVPPSHKPIQPPFLPTIPPDGYNPHEDVYVQNNIHRPQNPRDPQLPHNRPLPPNYADKIFKVVSFDADSPTSVKLKFSLPPILIGLQGNVDLTYKDIHDPASKWYSLNFAPVGDIFATKQLEFRLAGLKPSTTYRIMGKLHVHNLSNEIDSEEIEVTTMDLPSMEEKTRDIDSHLTLVDVNDTTADIVWRHFTEDELLLIDGIQIRYRPVGTPIYSMTELLHHSRTTTKLHDLRPGSEYEASLVLIPPPKAFTELQDQKRLTFQTSPYIDPYNWTVTVELRAVGSEAAELTWRGVPSPAERWVRVYRAAHACGAGRTKEHDSFRLASRDQPSTITLTGLEPNSRYGGDRGFGSWAKELFNEKQYDSSVDGILFIMMVTQLSKDQQLFSDLQHTLLCRVWLELFLSNGKVKTSNVLEVNTKSLDSAEPIDNVIEASSVTGGRENGPGKGNYYGALVAVGVVAALGAVTSLLLLLVVVRRHRPHSVPITSVPSAPRDSSLPPYDNPAYKLELQQETMDL